MARNLRKNRGIIYKLQREWGLEVTLYHPISDNVNLQTGIQTIGYQVTSIPKAPVLPASLERTFIYDASYSSANRNFSEGAFFDRKTRFIIVDTIYLPKSFEPTLDDFVTFKTERYEIKKVVFIEEFAAFGLQVVAVENQRRERWTTNKNSITLTAGAV